MSDYYDHPRVSFDDPRYRVLKNAFSLSKWTRENVMRDPPKYKVGDVVVLTIVGEITHVGEDCDGTPLYTVDEKYNGWGEESLRPATPEETEDYE